MSQDSHAIVVANVELEQLTEIRASLAEFLREDEDGNETGRATDARPPIDPELAKWRVETFNREHGETADYLWITYDSHAADPFELVRWLNDLGFPATVFESLAGQTDDHVRAYCLGARFVDETEMRSAFPALVDAITRFGLGDAPRTVLVGASVAEVVADVRKRRAEGAEFADEMVRALLRVANSRYRRIEGFDGTFWLPTDELEDAVAIGDTGVVLWTSPVMEQLTEIAKGSEESPMASISDEGRVTIPWGELVEIGEGMGTVEARLRFTTQRKDSHYVDIDAPTSRAEIIACVRARFDGVVEREEEARGTVKRSTIVGHLGLGTTLIVGAAVSAWSGSGFASLCSASCFAATGLLFLGLGAYAFRNSRRIDRWKVIARASAAARAE